MIGDCNIPKHRRRHERSVYVARDIGCCERVLMLRLLYKSENTIDFQEKIVIYSNAGK